MGLPTMYLSSLPYDLKAVVEVGRDMLYGYPAKPSATNKGAQRVQPEHELAPDHVDAIAIKQYMYSERRINYSRRDPNMLGVAATLTLGAEHSETVTVSWRNGKIERMDGFRIIESLPQLRFPRLKDLINGTV